MLEQSVWEPTKVDYAKLGNYLKSFAEIKEINAFFYSLSGVLVHNNALYHDTKIVRRELDIENINKYSIFPVILDAKIWGFILCDNNKITSQQIMLSKNYLDNIFTNVFKGSKRDVEVNILDPLSNEQLGQIDYLTAVVKMSFDLKMSVNKSKVTEVSKSLKKVTDYILNNINQSFSLNDLAGKVYLSPSYLSRLFKKYLNVTLIDYVNHLKIAKAKEKLAQTNQPINLVSLSVGFAQTSYFTKTFKKMVNMTPSNFREMHMNTQKIITIPRTIEWDCNDTIFEASKKYFQQNKIDFFYQSANSDLYINSIDSLTDSTENSGWLFTVDGVQPDDSANNINVKNASEIQWIYTDLTKI